MDVFMVLLSNPIINAGAVAWLAAQVIKTLLTLVSRKRLVLERMFGSGGMPSSHTALVCSIVVTMAKKEGISSSIFGLSIAFAAVVMYDAMGVRRAAGEQAKVLNKMIFEFTNSPLFFKDGREDDKPAREPSAPDIAVAEPVPLIDKELKEFLGHTPLEVLGGCLLGILVGVLMPLR